MPKTKRQKDARRKERAGPSKDKTLHLCDPRNIWAVTSDSAEHGEGASISKQTHLTKYAAEHYIPTWKRIRANKPNIESGELNRLNDLPAELRLMIVEYCNPKDVATLRLVNKAWRDRTDKQVCHVQHFNLTTVDDFELYLPAYRRLKLQTMTEEITFRNNTTQKSQDLSVKILKLANPEKLRRVTFLGNPAFNYDSFREIMAEIPVMPNLVELHLPSVGGPLFVTATGTVTSTPLLAPTPVSRAA